ncbi:MAG: LpxL/LpxP family Kdo(2)-lipid IV(A) lauroyl/palmitoleoyl acyltransferase [Gammaproteobacteria bacterium]|nr:LpxL/LpxP family Kdo(2)-lipid IV(A) lauroyl/palmitoleoyl acyltransferase [Gammaproteobacteria bacterium]
MSETFRPSQFLAPRHWPTWVGLGLVRIGSRLPYRWQLRTARVLGALLYRLLPSRRRIAHINVDLCFPERSAEQRAHIVREAYVSSAMAVFEMGLAWWADDDYLRRLHRVEGMEHLEAALAAGHGAILLGGHYTTIELSGRLMCLHRNDTYPVYKRARNPLYDAAVMAGRLRVYPGILNNLDLRTPVRLLKQGKVVWYAPDQDFGRERSVFAPFFGVPTATLTTTARLARLAGAPVLPFYSERLPGEQGYVIRVGAPLENFPSGDDLADATAINRAIEAQVRRTPEQYLWLHKRFKTRPLGEPPVYPK